MLMKPTLESGSTFSAHNLKKLSLSLFAFVAGIWAYVALVLEMGRESHFSDYWQELFAGREAYPRHLIWISIVYLFGLGVLILTIQWPFERKRKARILTGTLGSCIVVLSAVAAVWLLFCFTDELGP